MNATFLPDFRRSKVTWMGSIGITAMNSGYKKSNATSLRFVAKESTVYVSDKDHSHYTISVNTEAEAVMTTSACLCAGKIPKSNGPSSYYTWPSIGITK